MIYQGERLLAIAFPSIDLHSGTNEATSPIRKNGALEKFVHLVLPTCQDEET